MILNHEAHIVSLKDIIAHAYEDHPNFTKEEIQKFIFNQTQTLLCIEATIERTKQESDYLISHQFPLWK